MPILLLKVQDRLYMWIRIKDLYDVLEKIRTVPC